MLRLNTVHTARVPTPPPPPWPLRNRPSLAYLPSILGTCVLSPSIDLRWASAPIAPARPLSTAAALTSYPPLVCHRTDLDWQMPPLANALGLTCSMSDRSPAFD